MRWLKRIAREWVVVVSAIIGAAFTAADSAGWIENLFGYKPKQEWVYIGVFLIFAVIVIWRLARLQSTIDKIKGQVIFHAYPSSLRINSPVADEPPLANDEFSIYANILFEIWTDIDINTASLVLNIIGVRRWKLLNFYKKKRLVGIRMKGQESAIYRKKIKTSDEQPFRDQAIFEWRGKSKLAKWGDGLFLELALKSNIPNNIWRAPMDNELYERGFIIPL